MNKHTKEPATGGARGASEGEGHRRRNMGAHASAHRHMTGGQRPPKSESEAQPAAGGKDTSIKHTQAEEN